MASRKNENTESDAGGTSSPPADAGTNPSSLADFLARMQPSSPHANGPPARHKFWDTQPVPRLDDVELDAAEPGRPIEVKTVGEIRKNPYPLIVQFEWCEVDLQNPSEMDEVYKLLNDNYVEDTEASFRFSYSRDFLRWALLPPGWRKSWHVGVRVKASRKLVGFITAIPATISIWDKSIRMVEINFLCVHKKLRSKRLAPVLIKEITRRVNLTGVFQAVYTAGIVLPTPISTSKYWHRSLNPRKLISVGFSRLSPRMTMKGTIKLYSLPKEPQTAGIRPLEARDVSQAHSLVTSYLKKYKLRVEFTEDELAHWLLPRENVIFTYIVEDPKTHEITDLCSFYSLPSNIIRHPRYKTLNAAYMYYHVPTRTPSTQLMRDALILANNHDFDVFNALDLADNNKYFTDLRFLVGDGSLNYYLYNWKCPPMSERLNALVLV